MLKTYPPPVFRYKGTIFSAQNMPGLHAIASDMPSYTKLHSRQ